MSPIGHRDFVQYKRLLEVLYKLGIHTVSTAHQYNKRYYTDKKII